MTSEAPPLRLSDIASISVDALKGIGPKKRTGLGHLEIDSVLDLLTHYPRRYIDRTKEARVADMNEGEEAMVVGDVVKVDARFTRNRRSIVQVEIRDDTGRLRATFFNQQWRSKQLYPGLTVALFGKVELFQNRKQMTNPVVDLVGDRTGRIVPVYPQSEKAGLMTWEIAGWVAESLRRCQSRGIADPLPDIARERYQLIARSEAMAAIHEPETMRDIVMARTRLVFDELFRVQMTLLRRKKQIEATKSGIEHVVDGELVERFVSSLPFSLTGAQERTMREVSLDLGTQQPMHRLLQGDVGSGKTMVAVHALLVGVQGGHQGAFMAPTEVLAEQHYRSVRALLDGISVSDDRTLMGDRPLSVELLTNRVGAAERRRILAGLAEGSVDIAIGTHALIQDSVDFGSLGVVVVDEQHRFGVEQRSKLRERGRPDGRVPDLLVMTATPIPRTAAMTVYGDLDVSVLDELPPGRTPIATTWVAGTAGADGAGNIDEQTSLGPVEMWDFVRSEIAAGRQVYVVCPLIGESEKLDASSAEETYEQLSSNELSNSKVGLLHGRLSSDDKEAVMSAFRSGTLDVLVATTVIEVGVDVANATVMVILSADRFGIAQLHQLRGRVGRGEHASYCYLVAASEELTPVAEARLRALEDSTDGFVLAEVDLDLRGEGTIFDERQSGQNDLKLASLRRDRDWVVRARAVAEELLESDPTLSAHQLLADELDWFEARNDEDADFLLKS
jgi:ATP-dependent DNA helicase RecG